MEPDDLRRVLDQVKLAPEREDALLARLLTGERTEKTMMKTRKLSGLAAVAAAVALLVTCAFAAVATGLDQRIVNYFGASAEQEELLSSAAVPVDLEVTDNGSTLQIRQVIADRWSAVILMDFTAPEGTVLDGDYYTLGDTVKATAPDGTGMNSRSSGWELLEDNDPEDNHISLLFTIRSTKGDFNFLGAKLSLSFEGLYPDNTGTELLATGRWKCSLTLPTEDPGTYCVLDTPIEIGGHSVTLTSVYLSPISLVFELGEGSDDLQEVGELIHNTDDLQKDMALAAADSREIKIGDFNFLHTTYKTDLQTEDQGRYCFRLAEITDPAEVTSVTLFGQTFSLVD